MSPGRVVSIPVVVPPDPVVMSPGRVVSIPVVVPSGPAVVVPSGEEDVVICVVVPSPGETAPPPACLRKLDPAVGSNSIQPSPLK